ILSLTGNYDLANTGNLSLFGGTVTSGGGGPFTLSSSNAARLVISNQSTNVLNNVNLAVNSLDLTTTSGFLTLTNNATFAVGSAYTLGTNSELVFGTGQTSLSNVALTSTNPISIHGGLDNTAITLGPSGTAAATLNNTN